MFSRRDFALRHMELIRTRVDKIYTLLDSLRED